MYCGNISNNCACGAACSNADYCQAGGASALSCGYGNGYGSEYARGYSAGYSVGYNTGYDAGYNSGLNVGNGGGGFPPIVPPVATVPPVTLPAIRTNDVKISDGKNVAKILGVSFTLTDFMVSDGQPHSLAVGQTYSGTDTLTFPIGRHGTSAPGRWFYNAVGDGNGLGTLLHSIFRDDWGQCNFALLGDLTIRYDKTNGETREVTFNNVAFAQFHRYTQNNWNFGGKDWSRVNPNTGLALDDVQSYPIRKDGTQYIMNSGGGDHNIKFSDEN